MSCKIEFELPDWIYEIPFEEYCAIVNSCKRSASQAFYLKLDNIYDKRAAHLAEEKSGQLSIYDHA